MPEEVSAKLHVSSTGDLFLSTRSHCSHTRMPAESQYEVVPLHENPEHDGGAERPGSRQGRATRQALAFRAVSIALAATAMVVLCFGVVSREGHHQTEMIATSPSSSASAAGHRQQLARGRAESKRFLKEMGYPSDYLEADVQLARGRAESKRFLKEMGYPVGVPSANTTSPNTSSLRLHEKRNTTMLYRATRGASDPRTGKLSWFAQSLRVLVLPVRTCRQVWSTNTHTSCTQSRGSSWRIHCGVEVTESRTNKQLSLSLADAGH